LTAPDPDAGVDAALWRPDTVTATLTQEPRTGIVSLGAYVWGTLASVDQDEFGTLTIPRLQHNNGSKTGAVLSCALKINIPITSPVSDDNVDQGPLRLALMGQIVGPGALVGPSGSWLRPISDGDGVPRAFAWTGRLAR
jgi:hypothetical protein